MAHISSDYKEIASLNPAHGISIVQDISDHKIYVKKVLSVFQPDVYKQLMQIHINGIPCLYDLEEKGDKLIIIEEYISGNTLDELMDKGRFFTKREICSFMTQLCYILNGLHTLTPPVIHRDIKPSNIMLTPAGKIYLLDMNAAKYSDPEREEDTRLLGTKGYAAPEQYGFGSSTPQTDIYSCGRLLEELLRHSDSASDPVLNNIVSNCCNLDPHNRYADALTLSAAVNSGADSKKHTSQIKYNPLLPPGYRSSNPVLCLFSTVWYVFLAYVGLTFRPVNESSSAVIWLERIIFLLSILSVVFFSANYLNIHSYIPLCKSSNKLIRILGVILFDALIFFSWIVILILLEAIVR